MTIEAAMPLDNQPKMTVVLTSLSTIEIPGDDASVSDGVLTVFQEGSVSAMFAEGQWIRVEKAPAMVKKAVAPRHAAL